MINSISYRKEDPRWEIFGIKSHEEFIEKSVVQGHFSTEVPKSVIEEYVKVEHIQVQSYFHYPLYDEAFGAALRTVEMAFKSRCRQFNIPLTFKNRKGKNSPFTFDELIKKLALKEPNKDYANRLDSSRVLRNYKSHPIDPSYGMSRPVLFRHTVNLINEIFTDDSLISEYKNLTQRYDLEIHFASHINQLWSYPTEKECKGILLEKIRMIGCFPINKKPTILMGFIPILKSSNAEFAHPITGAFKDLKVVEDEIRLTGLDGKEIAIKKIDKGLNEVLRSVVIEKFNDDKNEGLVKETMTTHILGEYVINFKYENCWI